MVYVKRTNDIGLTHEGPPSTPPSLSNIADVTWQGVSGITKPNPKSKGFVLDPEYARLLFTEPSKPPEEWQYEIMAYDQSPAYFVVSPNVYVFDKNRIVCQVDPIDRFHEYKSLEFNPPKVETIFNIEQTPYSFDKRGQLWLHSDGEWHREILYSSLDDAREELNRRVQN
ncbi:hypothetical protein RhiJN_17280 [Ceratobasidium sp. AG-Ba]|nr:hypothetical protein RhiJN_17280 [Ceratobasidium sp. AG-Ba]